MTRDELIEKLKGFEWNDVEFKEARRSVPEDAWPTVSAFSNTAGGSLVFGVSDTNGVLEIVGVIEVDKVQNNFLVALVDEAVDLVLEELVALAQGDLTLQVEHHDVADHPFLDLHENAPDKIAM